MEEHNTEGRELQGFNSWGKKSFLNLLSDYRQA